MAKWVIQKEVFGKLEKENLNLGNAFDLGDIPKVRKVSGARKAAILLITLGADVSADIVKNLP